MFKASFLIKALTIVFLLVHLQIKGQIFKNEEYFIQNKVTGLLIDFVESSPKEGDKVLLNPIFYSKSQRVKFIEVDNVGNFYDKFYRIKPYGPSLLNLTIKKDEQKFSSETVLVHPIPEGHGLDEIATGISNEKPPKVLSGHVFSLEKYHRKRETKFAIPEIGVFNQVWKIAPVVGEDNFYFILADTDDGIMCIQPESNNPNSPVVLAEYVGGDIQKWQILPTRPLYPTKNVILSNFKYSPGFPFIKKSRVKGILKWENASPNLDGFRIKLSVEKKDFTYNFKVVNKRRRQLEFELDGQGSKNSYCFRVLAYNKWGAERKRFDYEDNIVCKKPYAGSRTPIQNRGISKISINNCHSNRKSVRVWSYDWTVNNGNWKNHGKLNHEWKSTNCSAKNPMIIKDLEDNHHYQIVIIDCGDSPPPQYYNNYDCNPVHTSPRFLFKKDGSSEVIDIGGS